MQLGREYEPKFPSQEQTDYLKWSFFCLLKKMAICTMAECAGLSITGTKL